jgi:uncharacterized protein
MIVTALVMGFAGSLHCAGMCSPLVMAVSNVNPSAVLTRLVYNLGRILTYGILGVILGTAGWVLPLEHYQNILSVSMGVLLLLIAIFGVRRIHIPLLTTFFQKLTTTLKIFFSKYLQRKNYASIFILGSLNGMLPCGLTFLALTYSLTLNDPIQSFYYMLLFGAGTLPVMLGLTTVFQYIVKHFNISFNKVATTLLVLSGCLLIVRVFVLHQPHNAMEEHGVVEIILCR